MLNTIKIALFAFLVTFVSVAVAQEYQFLLSDSRTVYLKGTINDATVDYVIGELQRLDKTSSEDITLVINSYGGSVYSGILLYDVMKSLDSDVKTVCQGVCMSMAAAILAAGEPGKREATKYSTVMVHEVSSSSAGTLSRMETDLKETKRLQELMVKMIAEGTERPIGEIELLIKNDFYMTAEEAVSFGFIDSIKNDKNDKELPK